MKKLKYKKKYIGLKKNEKNKNESRYIYVYILIDNQPTHTIEIDCQSKIALFKKRLTLDLSTRVQYQRFLSIKNLADKRENNLTKGKKF